MITEIRLCLRHSGRISRRKRIIFHSGLNVIAGPNGSGKSSLLRAVYECPSCCIGHHGETQYEFFDSETMNPHRTDDGFGGAQGSLIRIRAMFSSHGETMRDVLRFLKVKKGLTLLLDEPEAGHDFQWVRRIRHGLQELAGQGCQVIAASHHPLFWNAAHVIELCPGYIQRTRRQFQRALSKQQSS